MRLVHHVRLIFNPSEFCDHFVSVALVDQKPLPFPGESHFGSVLTHQSVKEGIVLLRNSSLLGSEDTSQPAKDCKEIQLP